MRKSSFILSIIISIALLIALVSTLVLSPVRADGFVPDCVCDHWNENWENYANDTYTATAITGHYPSPGAFDYADFIFQSGYGGTFFPKPNSPTYCYWQWAQGINWYSNSYYKPYNYVYKQPWPGGMYYYVNEYDYTLYLFVV